MWGILVTMYNSYILPAKEYRIKEDGGRQVECVCVEEPLIQLSHRLIVFTNTDSGK
jgi:hypothetical protein